MDLYAGIDVGTSGCRIVVIDTDEKMLAQASEPLPSPSLWEGHIAQDPKLWWLALRRAFERLSSLCELKRLKSLSIDATSGTLVAVDAHLTPMGPALMYIDAASVAEAAIIATIAPDSSPACGAPSGLAKWLWLRKRYPRAFLMHQADWLAQRLGARFMTSDENNALKTGYDPQIRAWPSWLKNLVDINDLMCIVPPGTFLGRCDGPFAAEFRLNPDTEIVAGTTDSNAAFLASGAQNPGDAVTSLGSTLAIKLLSDRPIYDAEYGIYSHRVDDRWLVGGASNTGGAVLRTFFSVDQIIELSGTIDPDKNTGLDYYPLNSPGERFPINDRDLQPRITPRPEDDAIFYQGLLEGIARIEALGYRRLHQLGATPVASVRSVGGGATNVPWARIRGRLLNVAMHPARQTEAAYGSALIAKRGVHCLAG